VDQMGDNSTRQEHVIEDLPVIIFITRKNKNVDLR